jgi:hypothetical protein
MTGAVFKLVKLIIGLLGLGAFVWVGLTVPLGDRTLFEHASAIGQSKESQELVRGTKEKVGDITRRLGADDPTAATKAETRPGKKPAAPADPTEKAAPEPQERLTNADRKEIRHFIDSARAKVSKPN